MNKIQRYVNLLLGARLGPIVRLYGIINGKDGQPRCECKKWRQCGKSAGKHPRSRNWLELGTSDSKVLWSWLTLYPHSNFGILTGKKAIAIDLDNRPDEGKDGQAALAGIEMPDTVVSLSGSGNGSKHLYFNIPEQKLTSTLPGVDIKAEGGMCVAPGSLHLSGRYYRFEGIHFKDVCDMPKALIEMFTPRKKELAKPSHLLTPFDQNNEFHAKRQAASDQGVGRPNSFE